MLAKLQQDMLATVKQMPEDWDETELAWYLVHRAQLFTRTSDRLRRIAYNNALRTTRGLGTHSCFRMESGPRHRTPACRKSARTGLTLARKMRGSTKPF
jgi:hypothetical protein